MELLRKETVVKQVKHQEFPMIKGGILWLLGVPLVLVVALVAFGIV